MPTAKILPTIMIALNLGAGLVHAFSPDGDWRSATYWFAAATLNAVVTW